MSDGPDDAINLYQQSLKADPFHTTAVLAWMGYDAPEFDHPHWQRTLTEPAELEQVGTPWRARQAGALLAADVNGLAATHEGSTPSHVTVLGHSYGSTTVADAFVNSGMRANDAVLTGCPGTDLAHRAADFRLEGGSLYVGAASTDAISWIGESGSGLPNGLNKTLGDRWARGPGWAPTRPTKLSERCASAPKSPGRTASRHGSPTTRTITTWAAKRCTT